MDKKMLKKILGIGAIVVGVLAFLTMFMDAGKALGAGLEGSKIAFGDKDVALKLNPIALVAYLLPLAGAVVAFLSFRKGGDKKLNWIAAILFLVGVILMILMPMYWYMFADGKMAREYYKAIDIKLAAGGILTVVFGILGAAACIVSNVVCKDESAAE